MKARLGVNIDHVATIRQARGESYPDLGLAARHVLDAGAEQITIHLREDRRHIQDFDLPIIKNITNEYKVPLNLEMGANLEILNIALKLNPEWVCLVPEKREEKTTEGGLDLKNDEYFKKLHEVVKKIKNESKIKISLFIEADEKILERVSILNAEAVEIHTGDYAKKFLENKPITTYLENYKNYHAAIKKLQMGFHAGHGLTDKSVLPLVEQGLFEEYNIGHWIVSESLYHGLYGTVKRLNKVIKKGYL
jgi:pyridoxine 5-phosphate synthase